MFLNVGIHRPSPKRTHAHTHIHLSQGHDTASDHKQSTCEVGASNVSLLKGCGLDTNFALFQ